MLEYALTNYFASDTVLMSYLYSTFSIYISQAPTTAKMPWMIVSAGGGSRNRITKNRIEDINTVRIVVDFPATQADSIRGRNAIERAKYLVENYRGDMGNNANTSHNAYDVYITCTAIEDIPGSSGTYRYQFSAKIRSIETVTRPV